MKLVDIILENGDNSEKGIFNQINVARKGLLDKVKDNPNFAFILPSKMKSNPCGSPNKCETNSYDFVKSSLEDGEDRYCPVAGFMFAGDGFFPIEHWWVFDKKDGKHIEVTPLDRQGAQPVAYAGVIVCDAAEDILDSRGPFDINGKYRELFKGGGPYFEYFK